VSPSADAASQERNWPLLLLVLGITVVAQLTFVAVPPVLPELADALEVSRGAVGLIHGIVALPGIFLSTYMGYLSDRFGRRRVVRASLLLYGAAGSACFFAGDFWVLLLLRVVQGVGASTLLSIAVMIIGDQFRGHARRWAMGLNVAAITVTGTLGPIASGFLGEGGAFRPFLLYLVAFPAFVVTRRLPGPVSSSPAARPLAHLREGLADLQWKGRRADFLGMLPVSLIAIGVFQGLAFTVTPLFLERDFGLSTSLRGLIQAIGSGVSSAASVLAGWLGSRFRPARLIAAALPLLVAGYCVVGVAPSLWFVGLGLGLVGAGNGSMFPVLQNYATSAGADRYRGVLVGTYVAANRVGMFAGPAGAGYLAATVGEQPSYLVGAAIVAVVAASWFPLRRLAGRRWD